MRFEEALAASPPDLALAALLLARELAYPDLAVASYQRQLDQLAALADDRLPYGETEDQVEALGLFLSGEIGFIGNSADYYDPRNSYLNEVLDRRLGIPITLSLVYMAVAERLGLRAHGIGLPGHFLVGVEAGAHIILVDPYHGGIRRSLAECAGLVAQTTGYRGPFQTAWLQPMEPSRIMARILHNLVNAYSRQRAWPQAIAAGERLLILEPEEPTYRRNLGLLCYQNGQRRRALDLLLTYLQQAPNAADAETIRALIRDIQDDLVRLN
ncbi:MAG: tetratricopeptide repeat protein [Anaerolineae bacterium]|nr:tetratricopeptide repeat protein [Caldilineales bacterium]MCX7852034.1 tetratricopeptide repeat protein [Caldilineales bacterium]MDW8269495.1 tetratricopeptide repeat protein [Anaerolineae bacterium]